MSSRLKNIKTQLSGMRLPTSGELGDSVIDGELSMDDRGDQQIIPGISLSPTGQATVDPALADILFKLRNSPWMWNTFWQPSYWLLAMDSLTNSHDYRPVIWYCRKCWPIT